MDITLDFLLPFTGWDWVVLGLILLGLELTTGTLDLFFVSLASFAAAIYGAVAPSGINGWEAQALFFVFAAIAMVVTGRVFFKRGPNDTLEHPTLNKRMKGLMGQRGIVEADFVGGAGRVRIGDTTWMAELEDAHANIDKDSVITVVDVHDTIVVVKLT